MESEMLKLGQVFRTVHLADKARKFADRTEEEFETFLAKAVQKVSDVVEGQSPFVCSSCSPENSDR